MKVDFKYLGTFKNNGNEYVVVEDTTNNVVNIFYDSIEYNDVECYQIDKVYINSFKAKDLFRRTKKCWKDLIYRSDEYVENHAMLQTFPNEFWDDIVIPIINGNENIIDIETK